MKVLIVDDEPLVRKSLTRALRVRNHEVFEAVDGREGFEAWLKLNPDLVLVDILMPGLTGPELLQAIRPKLCDWRGKTVLMSAYSGDRDQFQAAAQAGADLFIPKPFDDIFAVVTQLETLLGQEK